MKPLALLLTCLALLTSFGQALGQSDLPAEVREAAIADLNARIPGLGRPSFWQFQIISSNNTNLGCDLIPNGQGLASPLRVYVIELVYPTGARYTYRVSSELTYVLPCDLKLVSLTPPATPTQVLSTPSRLAQYNYQSQTCPPELEDFTESRLQRGQFALARVGDPVILYETFDASSPRLAVIPALNLMYVLAGPECTALDGVVWWQVEWNGQVGWTAESRLGGYYFLDFITIQEARISVPPTQSPTLTATLTPSFTMTPTITPSYSVTPSPSYTHSPTASPSLSPTVTATLTPSPTATLTPTLTATFTPSPTLTATLTPSPMVTPSATPPPPQLIPPAEDRQAIDSATVEDLTLLGQIPGDYQALVWREETLITGGQDGLSYWDAQTLQPLEAILPFDEAITALALDAEGRFMVIGGENGMLVLVNWESPQDFQMLPNSGGDVTAIQFNELGQFVAATDGPEASLKLWTADPRAWNTPNGLVMIVPQVAPIQALAFSPDGIQVASLDSEFIYIFDSSTGQTVFIQPLRLEAGCGGLAFGDGRLVYADCNTIYQVETATLAVTTLLENSESPLRGLMLASEGTLLAVRDADGLRWYAVEEAALIEVNQADLPATDSQFDPTGGVLSLLDEDGISFLGVQP